MRVDVVCSLSHYLAHCLPVWEALPAHLRGDVHPLGPVSPPPRGRVALVGGWLDVQPLRGVAKMIYVEHGAGQTYAGDPKLAYLPGYSASAGVRHHGVFGFISPSERVAARWTTAPARAVGCPKMDRWIGTAPARSDGVCLAWHWDAVGVAPEARSGYPHYAPHLAAVVRRWTDLGFKVYGHAHPRWEGSLDAVMATAGMEVLSSDAEVFAQCALLCVDNSSLGTEFMLLDRPVVWLNAPWYRRDIHHGGRFWEWTAGGHVVDEPEQLIELPIADLLYNDQYSAARSRVVADVYAHTDGSSARRAAEFIEELLW